MRNVLIACCFLISGCATKTILRDASVYQVELDQYHKWATAQAAYLRGFIEEHCECGGAPEGDSFASNDCEKAADFVLTVEARAEWHKQMSLWNAGLLREEPPASPPTIAPLSCPLPPAPSTEE